MTDIVERLRADAESTDDIGLCAEAADVIDALRRQLAEEHEAHLIAEQRWIEELNSAKADDLFAMRLLAESQAREKMRIEALAIADHAFRHPDDDWKREVDLRAQKAVGDALLISTDDTALRAALASERELCAKVADEFELCTGSRVAEAIRALGKE